MFWYCCSLYLAPIVLKQAQEWPHCNYIHSGFSRWIPLFSLSTWLCQAEKFRKNHVRPRPILVKFNSTNNVNTILSENFKLFSTESHSKSVSIKSDRFKEERQLENVLLTECQRLIDHGTNRKHIKIHHNRIFLEAKPIGLTTPLGFSAYPTLVDTSPSLMVLAKSVHHSTLHDQSVNLSSSTTSNMASSTSVDQPIISVPKQTINSSQICTYISSFNSQPENSAETPTTSLNRPVIVVRSHWAVRLHKILV